MLSGVDQEGKEVEELEAEYRDNILEEFCHKQEQRNEVGVGEGDRVKRVLGDEMVCLTLRRMTQQKRENGGYEGDRGEVQE